MVRLALAISLIIESISLLLYVDILWGIDKSERRKIYLGYLVGYLLIFSLHSFDSTWVIVRNFGVYTLVNILLLRFLHHLPTIKAICNAAAVSFLSTLAEMITGVVINHFVKYWGNWQTDNNLVLMAFSNILFLGMMFAAAFIQRNWKKIHLGNVVVVIIIVILFVMVEMLHTSMLESGQLASSVVTTCAILLAIVLILTLFLYEFMEKMRNESEKIKQQLQLDKDNARYVDDMMKRNEEQRILIHDIKNHLQTIEGLCEDSQVAAIEYISGMLASPALKGGEKYTENTALNVILHRYACEAKQSDISFAVTCDSVNFSFLSNYELSTLFCNILDNAIEASQKIQNAYIEVGISYMASKQLLVIRIVNSCKDVFKYDMGRLQTTKKEQKYHGYGLRSVEGVIKPHNGKIELYYDRENNSFHTIIVFSGVHDESYSV